MGDSGIENSYWSKKSVRVKKVARGVTPPVNHSFLDSRRASKTCRPVKVEPHVGQAQVLVFNSAFTSLVFSTSRPMAFCSITGTGRGDPPLLLKEQVLML